MEVSWLSCSISMQDMSFPLLWGSGSSGYAGTQESFLSALANQTCNCTTDCRRWLHLFLSRTVLEVQRGSWAVAFPPLIIAVAVLRKQGNSLLHALGALTYAVPCKLI